MGRAKIGTDLEATRQALTKWRSEHGGPGRRIPVELWDQAQQLARVHGVAQTARALRLDERRLATMLDQAPPVSMAPRTVEPEAFAKLDAVQVSVRADGAVVEMIGRGGDCVRVQVAAGAVDLVGLARAFGGRRA